MRPISVLIGVGLLLAGPAAALDLTTGLVAHYPFDGSAADVSGNGNHGVPNTGTLLTTDRFGQPDAAYAFDGLTSQIRVPGSTSLDEPDSAVTMAAWIELAGWSQIGQLFGPIVMKSESAANAFMYRMEAAPDVLAIAIGNWNNWAASAAEYTLHTWHHVASTWDGEHARFYLDGVVIGLESLPVSPPAADGRPLIIGADHPGILEVFNGKIDDVRIYNRALSSWEIADLAGASVAAPDGVARAVELLDAAPNPFNPATNIGYRLTRPGHVRLRIFDLAGRVVDTLVDGARGAGRHEASWRGFDERGREVSSGVYVARMEAMGEVVSRKLVLAR